MSDATQRSDEELMRAYVGGDSAAFKVLFERYSPVIFGMVRRHLRDEHLAQELTQQTFFRLHGARNDFRLDAKLRPWLLTIAMNLVREHWRKKKRRPHSDVELDERPAKPERDRLEVNERQTAVREALATLPTSQREVIEMHWFQEMAYRDIAEVVGSSEGAVRVRAHRGYEKLRSILLARGPESAL